MKKAQILSIIQHRSNELTALDEKLQKLEVQSSEGSINLKMQSGKNRFFYRTKDGRQVYLKDRKQIAALAQKMYNSKLKAAAELENERLKKCMNVLSRDKNPDLDSIYEKLPEDLKPFVEPDVITDEGYSVWWLKHSPKKADYGTYLTLGGEKVRSKSEVIIADRLFSAGIPYHYELPVSFTGVELFHPDFTVLNKRTRVQYYWEHLGMVDTPTYWADTQVKLENFAKFGIFPGQKLLLSFESSKRPLSVEYVDSLIEAFLK
ncbi:MAG: hypothetical protein ACTTJW_00950 [Sphaerochaeta sp.]